jgi:hypothetical protein
MSNILLEKGAIPPVSRPRRRLPEVQESSSLLEKKRNRLNELVARRKERELLEELQKEELKKEEREKRMKRRNIYLKKNEEQLFYDLNKAPENIEQSLLALENEEIKLERQRKEKTELELKKYLSSYCYNYDLKIIDVNVIDWNQQEIYFNPEEKNYQLEIPKTIRVTMSYSRDKTQNIINDYVFDQFIQKGSYGSVFKYVPKFKKIGISGFAIKVILSYNNVRSINSAIIPELMNLNNILDSDCKIIKGINFSFNNSNYIRKTIMTNYEKVYIYQHLTHNICVGFVCLPLADGNCSDLNNYLKLNLNQKKELFYYILEIIKCIYEKKKLVYPDIKLSQVLYFNCYLPDGKNKYIFVLGDIGGFQKLNDYPIYTYGPKAKFITKKKLISINIALYAIAATWHKLFSPIEKQLSYRVSHKHNIMYEHEFNREYVNYINYRVGVVEGLEKQREVIVKLLAVDPKKINEKWFIYYLEKLIKSFNLTGGQSPLLYLENQQLIEKRLEKEAKELKVKDYIKSYCYNYDLKFKNIDVLSYYKKKISSYYINIPYEIKVQMTYDIDESQVIYNNYIFDSFLESGSFGSVFKYVPKYRNRGISGIALKLIISKNDTSSILNKIIPEVKLTSNHNSTKCQIINSYNLKLEHKDYDYVRNTNNYYIYKHTEYPINLTMVCMPLADGDLFDLKDKIKVNFYQKKEMFLYVLNTLLCILNEKGLVYPDIKLEQILYFKCYLPDNSFKYIYVLADLGGFQTQNSKPVLSISPKYYYVDALDLRSIHLALYPIAGLWHDLFSDINGRRNLDLFTQNNVMFETEDFELRDIRNRVRLERRNLRTNKNLKLRGLVQKNLGRPRGLESARVIINEILVDKDFRSVNEEKVRFTIEQLIEAHNI